MREQRSWIGEIEMATEAAERLCRMKGLYGAHAEDFVSWVGLRLIENDYAILRKFRGDSEMKTYLTVVVGNLLLDYQDRVWGRWRPSAAARRTGPIGIALERHVYRDGRSLVEATEYLRESGFPDLTPRDAAQILARFPVRHRRSFQGDEVLATYASPEGADDRLLEQERRDGLDRASQALERALCELGPEDRTIIELRFREGLTVARIARALGLEQKPLYRRVERILARLRGSPALQSLDMVELME